MTEAILTSKQVKKLATNQCFGVITTTLAVIPGFPEYFFMGYRPGDAGDGNGEEEEPYYLFTVSHSYSLAVGRWPFVV